MSLRAYTLKQKCPQLRIKVSGRKQQLVDRIIAAETSEIIDIQNNNIT